MKFQCSKCAKLFESWYDIERIVIDDTNGYYLCSECIKERIVVPQKSLNSKEVIE